MMNRDSVTSPTHRIHKFVSHPFVRLQLVNGSRHPEVMLFLHFLRRITIAGLVPDPSYPCPSSDGTRRRRVDD